MTAAAPSRVVVALDYPDAAPALAFVARIDPSRCALKVGKELFVAAGPDLVRALVARGYRVFVDLKFRDIPNTVAGACAAVSRAGRVDADVHASGGFAMMAAARAAVDQAAARAGRTAPLLIAVTVLTSLTAADLARIGVGADPAATRCCSPGSRATRVSTASSVPRARRRRSAASAGRRSSSSRPVSGPRGSRRRTRPGSRHLSRRSPPVPTGW